jgi:hypothetical protein
MENLLTLAIRVSGEHGSEASIASDVSTVIKRPDERSHANENIHPHHRTPIV